MIKSTILDSLREEYLELYESAHILPAWKPAVERIRARIMANRDRYLNVAEPLNIPWWLVAVIHNMESSGSWTRHLHNGDPLSRPTRQVPRNRPVGWLDLPPEKRTWERSAMDALKVDRVSRVAGSQDLAAFLHYLEGFNGWGYRRYHTETPSPYLWSGTQIYKSGKYVADGKWSSSAVSKQVGCVAIMLALGITAEDLKY